MYFANIAQVLMGKYLIKKGNKKYRIVEIEFYAYSNDHKDYITYPREVDAGHWFFHQSGVDLTFESRDIAIIHKDRKTIVTFGTNPQFGGILIRGLYKLKSDKDDGHYVFGPQNCVNELWDKFNALIPSADEYPFIVNAIHEDDINIANLIRCKRCINIKEDKVVQKIKEWAKRLGLAISDKEIQKYQNELFNNQEAQLYRYFNLPYGEDPRSFTMIPASSRPKKIWAVK